MGTDSTKSVVAFFRQSLPILVHPVAALGNLVSGTEDAENHMTEEVAQEYHKSSQLPSSF